MRCTIFLICLLIVGYATSTMAQNISTSRPTMLDENEIVAYAYMGIDYALSGNHEKAIPILEEFIEMGKQYLPERIIDRARFCQLLGNSYIQTGKYEKAEELYLSTLQELSDNLYENEEVYRNLLSGLAVLYISLHNYSKANECIIRAKFLYEKNLDFSNGYVNCLSNMALTQQELGHKSFAKMCIDCAINQARSNFSDTTQMVEAWSSIGHSIGQPIDTDELSAKFDVSIKVMPFVTLLSNASLIYKDMGYVGDAVQHAKEALQVCEEYGVTNALLYNNVGCLYLNGSRFDEAMEYIEKAYRCVANPYEYDDIAFNLALSKFLTKSVDFGSFASEVSCNIRQHIGEAFEFMSEEERYNYWQHFDTYLPFLNLMIYNSGDEAYYGDIYDNIIKCKGLLLNTSNMIKEAIYTSGKTRDIVDYEEALSLKRRLSTTNDPIECQDISNQIDMIDKRLTREVASYADFKAKCQVDWHSIQDFLNDNDVAIEFYNIPIIYECDSVQNLNGEPRYCAVILKRGYEVPHIVPLCKEADLIGNEPENMYKKDSLYSLVWAPLEQELHGVENIYFAADREMHKIAIEYALLPNGKRMNDLYNIYRLSSTRELAVKPMTKKPSNAVLYGGLNYDLDKDGLIAECRGSDYHTNKATRSADLSNLRYGFNYLPGTMDEVEKIGDSFASAQIKYQTITGNTGTEESFRSLGNDINIIHLATHGFFWTDDEVEKRGDASFIQNINNLQRYEDKALLRSGLIFTGANIGLRGDELPNDVEDGVLTAQELSSMNLGNVDLVVLSACQSGLGETSGEGVFGLQRGFKLAGANTLLMSLWKVDDTATQMLMTEFYNNLLSGQSKVESLRNAQQYVRRQYKSDPYYWAGFILLDAID